MKYSNWAPTQFDSSGLGLEDRQDWIVAPVLQSRDSGHLEASNFAAALEIFGGESETCEVHRFGHWGPGWIEIILISPEREKEVDELQESLETYPVLNDEDYSEREYNDYLESWNSYGQKDFSRALQKEFEFSDSVRWRLEESDSEVMREWYESLIPSGEYYIDESSGVTLMIHSAVAKCSRSDLASFLVSIRSAQQKENSNADVH